MGVQGDQALLTEQDRLHVRFALVGTLLAVSPARFPPHQLSVGDPMVQPIKPGVNPNSRTAVPLPGRILAMLCEHLDHELPDKVQERLLLAGSAHAQPPGLDSADTERPGVDGPPPLSDAERYP